VITMQDRARDALRLREGSSMHRALELVEAGRASACVSAGNTGALMALAARIVGRLEVVRRPAIISAIPSIEGHTWLLDLGANTRCDADQLCDFAVMGECVAAGSGLAAPRIGLLNVGQERSKGTDALREAAARLQASPLDFVGFVEGHDIFTGGVDVVVADGFAGNVALKTMEGMARLVNHYLRRHANGDGGQSDTLQGVRSLLDPRLRNGAMFVGLRKVVIKSHGSADAVGFAHALRAAWKESRGDMPARIARRFAALGGIS
jgi:glycerol-3-phosphate acyltransferase PlsX